MWASRLAASVAVGVVGGIGWFRGGSGIAGWWWGRGAIGERSEGLMGLGRVAIASGLAVVCAGCSGMRSEEHTSELQSLMRISYAVFCLKKKKTREHSSKNVSNTRIKYH